MKTKYSAVIMQARIHECFIHGVILTFMLFPLILGVEVPLWAASVEEEAAAKIEGAKKEGKLLLYSNTSLISLEPMIKGFEKKYPFVKVEIYRIGAPKLLNKVLTEARAGASVADVIETEGLTAYLMMKKGLYAKYLSPESSSFPAGAKDPEGYWTSVFSNLKIIAYNTKMVSPKDAPRSWEDLLEPKWKGKMLMASNNYEWFGNVLKIMGEEKGMALMRKLSSQDLRLREGGTLTASLVVAGEGPISIASNSDRIEEMKTKRGAPVDWVGVDPVISRQHPIALARGAPRPNAAKLYIDYVLSREGQEIARSTLQLPDRADVKPPFSIKGFKLHYADLSLADRYEEITKKFDTMFKQR